MNDRVIAFGSNTGKSERFGDQSDPKGADCAS